MLKSRSVYTELKMHKMKKPHIFDTIITFECDEYACQIEGLFDTSHAANNTCVCELFIYAPFANVDSFVENDFSDCTFDEVFLSKYVLRKKLRVLMAFYWEIEAEF
jgi:hypothetical protein